LAWWAKHEQQYPNIRFLAHEMMSIVGSQIKIERSFSMSKVITSLKMLLAWEQELEQISYYHENLTKVF
jgi:hypothetical protein